MVETQPVAPRPVAPSRVDLSRFAREGEALTIRNTTSNIVVFVAKIDGQEEPIEIQAHGDPNGQDVIEVPSAFLKNARFREALKKDILKIEDADDPDVLDAFEAQKDAWRSQQAAKEANDALIAQQVPKAFSGVQCLAQEGRSQCAEFAIKANVSEKPPLCSKHQHLFHQYTPGETGNFIDGKPEIRWTRVTLER